MGNRIFKARVSWKTGDLWVPGVGAGRLKWKKRGSEE